MKCCVENMPSNTTLAPAELDATTSRPMTTAKPKTTLAPKTTPKPTEKQNNKEESAADEESSCPGVCVADRIAEYCEAYLITAGLCKSGSKCCVSRDIYPDKVPADLRVPTTHTGPNATKPSNNKPQVKVIEINRPARPAYLYLQALTYSSHSFHRPRNRRRNSVRSRPRRRRTNRSQPTIRTQFAKRPSTRFSNRRSNAAVNASAACSLCSATN